MRPLLGGYVFSNSLAILLTGDVIDHAYHLVEIAALMVIVIKWSIKSTNQLATMIKFCDEIRTNHLPHIETVLREICHRLDLDYETGKKNTLTR